MNSKSIKNTRFLCSLSAIAGIGLLTVSATAQDTCYRIIDLGDIGAEPSTLVGLPGSTAPFGINNSHQVVFNVDTGSEKRAYLYLQTAAFGLAAGVHNLHTLAGFDAGQDSAVHDINDAGLAVGWATFDDEQHAVVWLIKDHAVGVIPFADLGLLDLMDNTYSAAFAINNEDPPIIVGESDVKVGCFCEGGNEPAARGYWVAFTDPAPILSSDATQLVHDNNLGCKPITSTRDVNTTTGPMAPTIAAGISTDTPGQCVGDNFVVGTVWENGVAVGADLLSSGTSRWAARGVSDSGAVVGGSSGPPSALYWHATAVAPLDIGSLVTSGSIAQRINDNQSPSAALPLQAVGWRDLINPKAVLWECDGGCDLLSNWSATDINGSVLGQCGFCPPEWLILKLFDVNDNGWIIGVGESSEEHAVLLVPLESCSPTQCLGDIDGNGIVGANDLLILLFNWGPCPAPLAPCDADLDCDGSVGASDLLILLANWGPCGFPIASGPPQDVLDCINRFCCDEEDLLALEKCICSVDPECSPSP